MTYAEFYARIENFPNRFSNRSLASYLSALHALTEARQARPFTAELCLSLLERAFTAESVPFDAVWPVIRTAPADTEYAPFDYAPRRDAFPSRRTAQNGRRANGKRMPRFQCFFGNWACVVQLRSLFITGMRRARHGGFERRRGSRAGKLGFFGPPAGDGARLRIAVPNIAEAGLNSRKAI